MLIIIFGHMIITGSLYALCVLVCTKGAQLIEKEVREYKRNKNK